jgi:hypothetical protein
MKKTPLNLAAHVLGYVCLFSTLAPAQQSPYYNEPILPLFAKVQAPPQSVAEAFKMGVYKPESTNKPFSAPATLTDLQLKMEKIQQGIQVNSAMANSAATSAFTPSEAQMQLAKQMQDPAFQKKIEAMSQEEKMAFAMKMQQSLSAGSTPMQPEDEDVSESMNTIAEIVTDLNTKYLLSNNGIGAKLGNFSAACGDNSRKWSDWELAEVKKLPLRPPQNNSEGSPGKDPQKIKNIKLASIDKQIEFMNQQFKVFTTEWNQFVKELKPEIVKADAEFSKINYFSRVHNNAFKAALLGHQGSLVNHVQQMAGVIENIIIEAGKLYIYRMEVEKAPLSTYEGEL